MVVNFVLNTQTPTEEEFLTADMDQNGILNILDVIQLVGEVLGSVINDIMGAYDNAAGPVVNTVKESLGGDTTQGGSVGQGTVDNAINETNVLAAL